MNYLFLTEKTKKKFFKKKAKAKVKGKIYTKSSALAYEVNQKHYYKAK